MRRLAEAGFKEVWLTGVHLGSYGRDLRAAVPADRPAAGARPGGGRADVTFRLSSLEPMDCGDEIIDLVAASPRFAPHLHLPLQHASDRMLAAMRRPYTASRFRAIVERARERMPDAAIGTDVIVGFPGETERDFSELESFLREISPVLRARVPVLRSSRARRRARMPSQGAGGGRAAAGGAPARRRPAS